MKRSFLKNKIVTNYISVLLVILIVPLIVSTCLLQYTAHSAVSQSEKNSFLQLEQTREIVDRNMMSLRRAAMSLAQNQELLNFNSYNSNNRADVYRAFELAKKIESEATIQNYCEGIYVYSKAADVVFHEGAVYSAEEFFDGVIASGSYETWKRKLDEKYFDDCYAGAAALDSETRYGTVEYRMSYPIAGESKGTISFIINKEIFNEANNRSDDVQLYVLNENGEIVYTNDEEKTKDLSAYLELEDGYSYEGSGSKNLVCRTSSESGNLRYICIDKENLSFKRVNKIFTFSLFYAIVVLIAGSIYIFFVSRKLSENSEKIYAFLDSKDENTKVLDWNAVLDSLGNLSQKSNSVELLANVRNDMAKNKLFINLLYDRSGSAERFKEDLQELGIYFDAPDYLLVLGSFTSSMEEKPELIKYAIQNIMGDLLGNEVRWYFIDYNWNQVMFLLKGDFKENFKEEAENILSMTAEFIQSILGVELEFDTGDICHDMEGVRTTARRVLDYYEYRTMYNISDYNARSNSSAQDNYRYLQRQENELISLVLSGDAENTEIFLSKLIEEHNGTKPILLRILYFNLLGTLFKCADRMNISNLLENVEVECILYSQNIAEAEATIKRAFAKVCENAGRFEEGNHLNALSLKLMNYVDTNFQEPSLSLKTLSGEYGITVSYASKIFKERIGNNFSDYLTEKRIEKAKQLLEETNLSISEIAQKVGYIDSSIFIKNFKKIIKMTPGAYRDTIK